MAASPSQSQARKWLGWHMTFSTCCCVCGATSAAAKGRKPARAAELTLLLAFFHCFHYLLFFQFRWLIRWREVRRCDGGVRRWRQREDFSPQHPPPASGIPDSLWVSPVFLYPLSPSTLLTILVVGVGGESTPAPLTSMADNRSSTLEQAPISDRPCDRLDVLNPQNNSQTVPKRRPGEMWKHQLKLLFMVILSFPNLQRF